MNKSPDAQPMEKIVSLCKRRGFIFQSSEIYGGLNGAWDYGPLGVELKRNLKNYWWRVMVHERDDVVGLDGAILTHPAVLKASGHVEGFSDPMVDCRLTNQRFRADQIPLQSGTVFIYEFARDATPPPEALLVLAQLAETDAEPRFDKQTIGPADAVDLAKRIATRHGLSIPPPTRDPNSIEMFLLDVVATIRKGEPEMADKFLAAYQPDKRRISGEEFRVLIRDGVPESNAEKTAREFYRKRGLHLPVVSLKPTQRVENNRDFNPENGAELTQPRPFNLMLETYLGAVADESSKAYLRPETAQSIFVQFKNVLEVSRKKLPFGIAQIGKAFRNEINPRNFTFRSREFEQMELEYFCRAEEGMKWLDYWLEERLKFYENIGIPRTKLHAHEIPDEERAFYSKGTYDIEFDFPFGRQELEGVAYRTDYDLQQHQKASGKSLEYFDEETKQRFIPHVVEPSAGVDRAVLALICEAYEEDTAPDEKGKLETRIVLRFHPRMAPIKCAVFPLLKNKEPLIAKAKEIIDLLRPHMNVFYDEGGAIGRRYRRQDEIGTPFAITVDFETLGEKDPALRDTVTLRDRDSMKQERVPIKELVSILASRIR
ncbi:MAG TPA: glycine--tRNA ligase [Chthoniobacterales bacterium]|nr:glycine--tRNA ligase [Chthoniobacterales bacterium]